MVVASRAVPLTTAAGDKLGRVYSVDAVGGFMAVPLGEVPAGPLSVRYGANPLLILAGLTIVAVTVLALVVPEVRNLERQAA
jgi:hypothetical protein